MAWRIGVALGLAGRHYPGGVCADAAVGAADVENGIVGALGFTSQGVITP